jgi:nicotinamide-nucleotide amidase
MKAEIIAVGTELLLGEVVNTNASWLSKELAALGVDVYHHVTVGDNPPRLSDVFRQAAERADWLIITGGLGPTDDDLTVSTLADCFATPLISDADSEAAIRLVFERRGIPMPASNLCQALKPQGAITLPNPIGTAPGLAWRLPIQKSGQPPVHALMFPGVPKELYALWPQARDFIRRTQQEVTGRVPPVLVARFLHFFGISESALAEQVRDLMQGDQPSVAPYVGKAGIRLRLAVKTDQPADAEVLIEQTKAEILSRLGTYFIGESTGNVLEAGEGIEKQVAELLLQRQWRLAIAESCTGGLISSRLTDIPGSSSFMSAGLITYTPEEKIQRLGVRPETLERFGVISPETAAEMAFGLQQQAAGYDLCLSITGQAGPLPPNADASEPPPGVAYVGLSFSSAITGASASPETALTFPIRLNPAYERVMLKGQFAQYALYYLYNTLLETPVGGVNPAFKTP